MKDKIKGFCKDCYYNISNYEIEEGDITDYYDVVCTYWMSDGVRLDDYCSNFKEKESK